MEEIEHFKLNLGKRIVFLRNKKGLTQPQLAALINKDFQSISRVENGHINLSAYALKQIADALNVSMDEIFDFTELNK